MIAVVAAVDTVARSGATIAEVMAVVVAEAMAAIEATVVVAVEG